MQPLGDADIATVLDGRSDWVDDTGQTRLATHPLDSIDTEYPHHAPAADSPEPPARPSERHPAFYGCYDWHSAVHSHWSLVRQLRLFDDHPDSAAIVEKIDPHSETPSTLRP